MLLLGWRGPDLPLRRLTGNDWRLFGKNIPQDSQEVENGGLVPIRRPAGKVGMIDLTLGINVLAGPDHDVLGRGHVDQGGISRIGVGNP